MTISVTYQRGLGGYTFSAEELAELSILRAQLQSAISGGQEYQIGLGGDGYRALLRMISDQQIHPDEFGGFITTLVPKAGVDLAVWSWINGAVNVNANQGFNAAFIREYTKIQFELRGLSNTASPEQLNQSASNNIALNLLTDVVVKHTLPGIEGLGAIDAGAAASTVFTHHGLGEYAPWAGTLLFPFLGEDKFYRDLLLSDETVAATIPDLSTGVLIIKYAPGTYDLIASIEASERAATAAGIGNILGAISSYFGVGGAPYPNQSAMAVATTQWFNQYYGLSAGTFNIGADTVFNASLADKYDYFVGTYADDNLVASGGLFSSGDILDASIMNGGFGNDTITGTEYGDLLDGDQGNDTLHGGEGADFLFGGIGNDNLFGGQNNDRLYGGQGADQYRYATGDGIDTIYDTDSLGTIFINGIALVGSNAELTTYKNRRAWRIEVSSQEVMMYELVGSIESLATLRIEGSAFGTDGLIDVRSFANDALDLHLDVTNKVRSLTGAATLREGLSATLGMQIATFAAANQVVRFSVTGLQNNIKLVTGAETLSFNSNGTLDITLEAGQTIFNYSLFSQGDVDDDTPITLTATLLDAQGNPMGEASSMNIAFDATDEWAATLPSSYDSVTMGTSGNDEFSAGHYEGEYTYYFAGNDGDDKIYISGGAGLLQTAAAAVVEGGNGRDNLIAAGYAVWITGGTGNDCVYGYGLNAVTLSGGTGSDVILAAGSQGVGHRLYGDAEIATDIAIAQGNTAVGDASMGDLLSDSGEGSDDLMIGSNARDVLAGGGGRDQLIGGGGDDLILGDVYYVIEYTLFDDAPASKAIWSTFQWSMSHSLVTMADGSVSIEYAISDYVEYNSWDENDIRHTSTNNFHRYDWPGDADTIYAGTGNDSVLAGEGDDFVDAGAGDDIVLGDIGNDTLLGGDGSDMLFGGGQVVNSSGQIIARDSVGQDFLDGGNGDDQLSGSDGDDVLFGGADNDTLYGDNDTEFDGSDYLNGEDGDDILVGGGKADTLIGGIGNDHLYGDFSSTPAELQGDDYLDGGAGDDVLIGEGGADTLIGGDGNDELSGDAASTPASVQGDDYLDGGNGSDTLIGGGGNDTMIGGADNDFLYGDDFDAPIALHGDDYLDGGDGDDILIGEGGKDTLIGGAGKDQLVGDSSSAPIESQADDFLDGGDGEDALFGFGGNDTLLGGNDNDYLDGGAGNDTLTGGLGVDVLRGGAGDDVYVFNAGDFNVVNNTVDYIADNEGTNRIEIQSGLSSTEVTVGLGGDYGALELSRAARDVGIVIEGGLVGSIASVTFSDGVTLTVPELVSTLYEDDLYLETTQDNAVLYGGLGNDQLSATGNDSRIAGGLGVNTLTGGAGSTTYTHSEGVSSDTIVDRSEFIASNGLDVNTLELGEGIAPNDVSLQINAGSDEATIRLNDGGQVVLTDFSWSDVVNGNRTLDAVRYSDSTVETWEQFVTARRITIYNSGYTSFNGTNLSDDIYGSYDNETIDGGEGDDLIDGGWGNDVLSGGAGSDRYLLDRGSGSDTIRNYDNDVASADRLELAAGIAVTDVEAYRVGDSLLVRIKRSTDRVVVENHFSTGALDEIVFADGTIWGSAYLSSLVNNPVNVFTGTSGNDTFVVDNPFDSVIEVYGAGTDTVLASVSYTLSDNVENLTLTGTASIEGFGNDLNNTIIGNAGANTLDGDMGVDVLSGGAGDDTYYVDQIQSDYFDNHYQNFQDAVLEAADGGIDTIFAVTYSAVLPNNVERLIISSSIFVNPALFSYGHQFNARFTGNNLDNFIDASAAFALTFGVLIIDGGTGADWMIGGTNPYNRNVYVIDNPGDVVVESANPDHVDDRVESYIDYTLGSGLENLTLLGTASVSGTGNFQRNVLAGNAGNNVLTGGGGNDDLDGGGGADTLVGGTGDDHYWIDSSSDVVTENLGEGFDTVEAYVNYVAGANIERVVIGWGALDLNAIGNELDNYLIGNPSRNVMDGGLGNDRMEGDGGDDRYIGFGTGAGVDVIADFDGYDTIEFASSSNTNVEQLAISRQGDNLRIGVSASDSVVVESWFTSPSNQIEQLTIYESGLAYTYSASQLTARTTNTNAGPIVNASVAAGNAAAGTAFAMQLALNTFADIESQHSLIYSATLANGSALPSWLTLNSTTRTFSGTPGSGAVGDLSIRVTATDASGASAFTTFTIHVTPPILRGTAGDDVLTGDSSDNVIDALAGNDSLLGLAGNDVLHGGDGNDVLDGGSGNDTMDGGLGNDVYVLDNVNDVATENLNEGIDEVRSAFSYTLPTNSNFENVTLLAGATTATGNSGDNVLTGNSGNNTLTGNAGNDTLNGGGGTDQLTGGAGNDTYVIDGGDTITETSTGGADIVLSTAATFTLPNFVENLTLLGSDNIGGTGNNLVNIITGNAGNNALSGGTGADQMIGGAGNDTYTVDNAGDAIIELDNGGTDTVTSSVNYALGSFVENLTVTGTASGTGNELANVLDGSTSSSANALVGGAGDDTYIVGAGDTVSESLGNGTDLVQSSVTFTLGNYVENLTLTGSSGLTGTGNTLDNILIGNTGSNTLNGGDGNDTLDPGSGTTETLAGGNGNDTYKLNRTSGITITETSSGGVDTIESTVSVATLAAFVENVWLKGTTNNITATGSATSNWLWGNGLNNTLTGSGGNDLLFGDAGVDTLTGSTGRELLIAGTGNDAITTNTGADIIAFNKGDGQDTVAVSTTKDNVVSIGGGALYSDLLFQKTGNDLLLKVGAADQITFTGYYASTSNRSVNTLQVVIDGTTDYLPGGGNATRDHRVERFDFGNLVSAFDAARTANPSLTTWALTNALAANAVGGSDSQAFGGEVAYQYARLGGLNGVSTTAANAVITNASFGTGLQSFTSIAGPSGLMAGASLKGMSASPQPKLITDFNVEPAFGGMPIDSIDLEEQTGRHSRFDRLKETYQPRATLRTMVASRALIDALWLGDAEKTAAEPSLVVLTELLGPPSDNVSVPNSFDPILLSDASSESSFSNWIFAHEAMQNKANFADSSGSDLSYRHDQFKVNGDMLLNSAVAGFANEVDAPQSSRLAQRLASSLI